MKDDKRIKRKVLRSYIVSTVSISLVIFLLGSVGYMLYSALGTAQELKENITLSVELDNALDKQGEAKLQEKIRAIKGVSKITYSSKEEKLADEEFRQMFGQEIEEVLGENPLRNSFEVGLTTTHKSQRDQVVEQIKRLEGVTFVSYPEATIENLHSSIRKITIILAVFGGALLVISLILLNNTIRLAIYSRRHLINTFKLVGATKWYIMKPFIFTASRQGLCAGFIASILFFGALFGLQGALPEVVTMTAMAEYYIVMGIMVAAGLVISVLFTTFAVNKFVNMKSDKIRLY